MTGTADERALFEKAASMLVGRAVLGVRYSDIHNFSDEPRRWDYEDWHHAVMGAELLTDGGPFTITWTKRFYAYGVEVFAEPIEKHLVLGPEGPEIWDAENGDRWRPLLNDPIKRVALFWERVEVGPAIRQGDGVQVSPAAAYDVPVGIRLDFSDARVWMLAGMPLWPDTERFFVPADEIVVAFTPDRVEAIGFPRDEFTRPI